MTQQDLIVIALGANLPHPIYGAPDATLTAALAMIEQCGPRILKRSGWWSSPPWPPSDQPWYVNGAATLETAEDLGPDALLTLLHEVEASFGRVRNERNAARMIDLDLISWRGVARPDGPGAILPHPRWRSRGFVLRPLLEVAPDFRCPTDGARAMELLAALTDDQTVPLT